MVGRINDSGPVRAGKDIGGGQGSEGPQHRGLCAQGDFFALTQGTCSKRNTPRYLELDKWNLAQQHHLNISSTKYCTYSYGKRHFQSCCKQFSDGVRMVQFTGLKTAIHFFSVQIKISSGGVCASASILMFTNKVLCVCTQMR